MADETSTPFSEDEIGGSDTRTQNATSRAGAEAAGGTAPQPGDAATPEQAAHATAENVRALRNGAFGDHKGGDIDDHGGIKDDNPPPHA